MPAYPSYRSPEGEKGAFGTGEANRLHWCPLFEKFNVDVVLEHHDHTFKRTHPLTDGRNDKNGVLYLGDGSWGKLRAPKKPEQRPYLAAVSKAYHMTVHRLEGQTAISRGARKLRPRRRRLHHHGQAPVAARLVRHFGFGIQGSFSRLLKNSSKS